MIQSKIICGNILLSKDINEYNNDISDVLWQMNENVDINR